MRKVHIVVSSDVLGHIVVSSVVLGGCTLSCTLSCPQMCLGTRSRPTACTLRPPFLGGFTIMVRHVFETNKRENMTCRRLCMRLRPGSERLSLAKVGILSMKKMTLR